MKKLLDTTRMKEFVNLSPINVKEGLEKTIKWYQANKELADAKA